MNVTRRAFTLVEILVVVVVLGILTAIVVPQFASATGQSQKVATLDQLRKIRSSLTIYYLQRNSRYPNVTSGEGTWGELISLGYMREPPVNSWIGTGNSKVIAIGGSADTGWQTTHGWVYDTATGDAWAGSFSSNDTPFPRP
jgi:general secretion pathway protein G